MTALTTLTKKNVLTALTGLTGPNGKGGKGVRVACASPWACMLAHLTGKPIPPPQELPGRKHEVFSSPQHSDLTGRVAVLLSDMTDAQCADKLGLTRQRVNQMRHAMRAADDRLASSCP